MQFLWTGWFMYVINLDSKDKLITLLWLLLTSTYKKLMIFQNLIFNLLVQLQCLLLPNFKNSKLWVQEISQNQLTIDILRYKSDKWKLKYADVWIINWILQLYTCGQIDLWLIGTVTYNWLMPNITLISNSIK